jgi:hypothetical protein
MTYWPVTRQRPRKHEIKAIAVQALRKYATVLEPLLGSDPRATMEVPLEAMFSMWPSPRLHHSTDRLELVGGKPPVL